MLENVLVLDVAACNGHEVEVVWEMESHVELDDVVELVAVLGMVAVELVMGKETSVVVWAVVAAVDVLVVKAVVAAVNVLVVRVVVAAVDVLVVNTARDTSWLLGKSNKVDVSVNRGVSKQSLNSNE